MQSNFNLKNRKFTDIICAVIFIAYTIFMVYIAIYGMAKGDLDNIAQPYDADGKKCGEGDQSGFEFVYVNDLNSTNLMKTRICIKECPGSTSDKVECVPTTTITSCNDINVYKSYGLMDRICLPSAKEGLDKMKNFINVDYSTESIQEIRNAWLSYIVAVVLAIVLSIAFYILMRYFAFLMIWLTILGALVSLVLGGVLLWQEYLHLDSRSAEGADRYKWLAILCWIASGIYILFILCICSQINLALNLIKAASEFVSSTPTVIFIPLIQTAKLILFIIFWLVGFAYIYSVGELEFRDTWFFGKIYWTNTVKWYVGLMVLGGLWYVSFILAVTIFVIASMSATWYFNKSNIFFTTAYCWAYSYHLGSLAFGSLLVALLWFIQIVLNYVYQKVKNTDSTVKWLVKCAMCFVACFERIMKFINRHAYIEVILRNKSFCPAVAKTVALLTGNFIRMAALMGLVSLILILGTLFITFMTTWMCFYVITAIGKSNNVEYQTYGPLIVCALIAIIISLLFNYIFSISSDTMLHCHIFEEENPGMQKGKAPSSMIFAIEKSYTPVPKNNVGKGDFQSQFNSQQFK